MIPILYLASVYMVIVVISLACVVFLVFNGSDDRSEKEK